MGVEGARCRCCCCCCCRTPLQAALSHALATGEECDLTSQKPEMARRDTANSADAPRGMQLAVRQWTYACWAGTGTVYEVGKILSGSWPGSSSPPAVLACAGGAEEHEVHTKYWH